MSGRNVFEHTSPDDEELRAMQESARKLGGDLYTVLPDLPEDQRYEIGTLNGRTVLVTKKS